MKFTFDSKSIGKGNDEEWVVYIPNDGHWIFKTEAEARKFYENTEEDRKC